MPPDTKRFVEPTADAPFHRFACLIAACLAGAPTHAQEANGETDALAKNLEESASQLTGILREHAITEKRAKELAKEVARIRKDRESLNTALIQTAKTEKKLATDVLDLEERLVATAREADTVRASLRERRGLLAEVLAALQRMGLNPPSGDPRDAGRRLVVGAQLHPAVRGRTRHARGNGAS